MRMGGSASDRNHALTRRAWPLLGRRSARNGHTGHQRRSDCRQDVALSSMSLAAASEHRFDLRVERGTLSGRFSSRGVSPISIDVSDLIPAVTFASVQAQIRADRAPIWSDTMARSCKARARSAPGENPGSDGRLPCVTACLPRPAARCQRAGAGGSRSCCRARPWRRPRRPAPRRGSPSGASRGTPRRSGRPGGGNGPDGVPRCWMGPPRRAPIRPASVISSTCSGRTWIMFFVKLRRIGATSARIRRRSLVSRSDMGSSKWKMPASRQSARLTAPRWRRPAGSSPGLRPGHAASFGMTAASCTFAPCTCAGGAPGCFVPVPGVEVADRPVVDMDSPSGTSFSPRPSAASSTRRAGPARSGRPAGGIFPNGVAWTRESCFARDSGTT